VDVDFWIILCYNNLVFGDENMDYREIIETYNEAKRYLNDKQMIMVINCARIYYCDDGRIGSCFILENIRECASDETMLLFMQGKPAEYISEAEYDIYNTASNLLDRDCYNRYDLEHNVYGQIVVATLSCEASKARFNKNAVIKITNIKEFVESSRIEKGRE